jgi:hypothetical protein
MAFSLKDNFKKIQWVPTFLLHLMRAFSAGLIWCLVMMFTGARGTVSPFSILLTFPIIYFTFVPMILVISKIMSIFIDVLGEGFYAMVSFFFALLIIVGDPLLFVLNKLKPGILPVEKFNIVNFSMMLFILDPIKV